MRERLMGNPARMAWLIVVLAAAMVFVAGCGGDDDGDGGDAEAIDEIGEPEGELNLIAWAGYVEDGSTDPKVDWVSDFEEETGCDVKVKVGGTSDEMVQLMRTGEYDGVSASGNASVRLYEGGDVDPINVDLVPNYQDIVEGLKDQPYNTFDGVHYGIPHARGWNILMWNADEVSPTPTSWDVILDPEKAADYEGRISVYDDPIYIADAALYLMAHEPDLGIEDPYELDEEQFDAAVDLLREQRPNVGEYWADYLKQIQSFANGDVVVGTTWPYQYFTLLGEGEPVEQAVVRGEFLPEEGATGWSDTWMMSSEAEHPNCMYLWFDHITSPEVQAQVALWFGEAPANPKACDLTGDLPAAYFPNPNHCEDYHATDEGFWDQIYFWKTPLADCGDDRGEECADYNEWVQAWTEIKG